jgi:integrase
MTQVAMHPVLARALQLWRRESLYHREADWVFASTKAKGKKSRSAGVAGQDYLRPAAVRAGVIAADYRGWFGWHNLRHSLGTFFANNEVNLPLIQSALRHANPGTTGKYIHRVNCIAVQEKFLTAIGLTEAVA